MSDELVAIPVDNIGVLAAQNRTEIDMQIATAHQYPRNIDQVLRNIEMLAEMDEETASSCFYVLRRQGQEIKGLSVRMAEIVASQWGNARFDKRIIANDGKTITAQCTAHDLESNLAIRTEVKRRITDKYGKTYSEDMQVTTGNAAMAIAFRNAVMQIIPQAIFKKIIAKVDEIAFGKALSLEETRNNLVKFMATLGVTEEILLDHCGVTRREDITPDMIATLRGECNAIKEGTTTADEEILKPYRERQQSKQGNAIANDNKQKAIDAATKAFNKVKVANAQANGNAVPQQQSATPPSEVNQSTHQPSNL